ncbi:EXOSC9 [Bugula neritina]|uniref:EXOSC9 n=1 Tax=Bugula neritina TaxID=10212 RepID=A0A7J7KRT6_BUGNE|nr:EXOSC9 [Bugula neritina]
MCLCLQVWEVRVDVKVLNHAGNILDACSLAAISALAHFRRPDVTVSDGKVFIHPEDEKAYIPLSVHHMPICTSFSFFHSGKYLLFDASYEEERVMEGQMIIAMNKHREICALHMSGTHLLHKDQVKRCTNIAASKVMQLDELVHRALQNDKESRDRGDGPSSAELNTYTKIDVASKEVKKNLKLRPDVEKGVSSDDMGAGDSDRQVETGSDSDEQVDESDEQVDDSDEQVSAGGADEMDTVTDEHWSSEKAKIAELQATAEVGLGGQSTWGLLEQEVPLSEQTKMIARKRKSREKRKAKPPSSDSEEEETVTLSTPG